MPKFLHYGLYDKLHKLVRCLLVYRYTNMELKYEITEGMGLEGLS